MSSRDPIAWAAIVRGHRMMLCIAEYKARARERRRCAAENAAFEASGGRARLDAMVAANHAAGLQFMDQFQAFASANQLGTVTDPNARQTDRNDALRFMLGSPRHNGQASLQRAYAAIDAAAAEWMAGAPERARKAAERRAAKDTRTRELHAAVAAARATQELEAA